MLIWAAVLSEGFTAGESAPKFTHMAVGQILFLGGCWAPWLWASYNSLQHGPFLRVTHNVAAGFYQNEQERESKRVVAVFLEPNSEATYHHFFLLYLLQVRQ